MAVQVNLALDSYPSLAVTSFLLEDAFSKASSSGACYVWRDTARLTVLLEYISPTVPANLEFQSPGAFSYKSLTYSALHLVGETRNNHHRIRNPTRCVPSTIYDALTGQGGKCT
jgi:hypothetical protein